MSLLCEQNTQELEKEIDELLQDDRFEDHKAESFYEHGQWFITCLNCGRLWSVVDVEIAVGPFKGATYIDAELVESGDESCY